MELRPLLKRPRASSKARLAFCSSRAAQAGQHQVKDDQVVVIDRGQLPATLAILARIFHTCCRIRGWDRRPACPGRRLADRNVKQHPAIKRVFSTLIVLRIPPGQWPGGTGGSPVPPRRCEIYGLGHVHGEPFRPQAARHEIGHLLFVFNDQTTHSVNPFDPPLIKWT